MLNKLLILGEAHTSPIHVKSVNEAIVAAKPDILLHELAYEDVALHPAVLAHRLKHCAVGQLCDPRLNQDIYRLAHDHRFALVGIDVEVNKDLPFWERFELREQHMVKMINRWSQHGDCVVVVGDAHLRDGSPLIKEFQRKATIIRAPLEYREM